MRIFVCPPHPHRLSTENNIIKMPKKRASVSFFKKNHCLLKNYMVSSTFLRVKTGQCFPKQNKSKKKKKRENKNKNPNKTISKKKKTFH